MNEPGCTLKFVDDSDAASRVSHNYLKVMMKEKFKDPASISRTIILDLVKEAQAKGEESVKALEDNSNIE